MFRRILIANRGEIAVRVIRACREMGIESVAVYSDADARAPHALLADRAVRIGPPPAAESYLSIGAIIDAARASGADAIHPGYGFLSENAAFARACAASGITFIGPPADAIDRMGSKIAARILAARAGVPVVPGETPADQSDQAIAAAVTRIGLPVLLKPSEGGGGIGMKAVREEAALLPLIAQARREATAAFGDGTLYVERLIERPRHVEFQILADAYGGIVHVFERECSVQRRHQKVIEETPSVAMTPALRVRMGEAAVAVARAAGYRNAGTIEFLLDGAGSSARFYFLEMNTRLQVEHPVTEQVAGIDLVQAQIRIAAGASLPWTQGDLAQRGHAIEARVYAEDPARNDLPQAGPLLLYRQPVAPGIRIDSGVTERGEVTVHYDPLLAKVIATGETREAARVRMVEALRRFAILGIRTNVAFLIAILEAPWFTSGDLDTRRLDRESDAMREILRRGEDPPADVRAIAEAVSAAGAAPQTRTGAGVQEAADPWTSLRGLGISTPPRTRPGNPGDQRGVTIASLGDGRVLVEHGATRSVAYAAAAGPRTWVFFNGRTFLVNTAAPSSRRGGARPRDDEMALASPMPAVVVAVNVAVGQQVAVGDVLVMLEAMKMELPIRAPRAATVKAIACRAGELVQPGVPLLELA